MLSIAALLWTAAPSGSEDATPESVVRQVIDGISENRVHDIIAKLEAFGTRNTLSSQDNPNRGIGAARKWIFAEFQSYSPRLQVRFDRYRVKKQGERVFQDVDLYNVVAVLPGFRYPETQILISGHYDSLNLGNRPPAPPADVIGERPAMTLEDARANAGLPAPGACDDGSGVAAVMELARVMSQFQFDKTLVFVAFAGEEQGLIGSSLYSAKARKEGQDIEAVLNNDIIGTAVAGNGRGNSNAVSVYSDDSADSGSQELARFVREAGERYDPSMEVNTVFLSDRLGRGGDHTPFQWEGYSAVRFSTPNEIYANQHHATDTLANMSVPYTTRVIAVNAAVAASLALAPKAPAVMRQRKASGDSNDNRPLPMISRGQGYDTVLQWRPAASRDAIKGYAVVFRSTTSPYWDRELFVGDVKEYALKDISPDALKFGVRAVGANGYEGLVSPYIYPERLKKTVETAP